MLKPAKFQIRMVHYTTDIKLLIADMLHWMSTYCFQEPCLHEFFYGQCPHTVGTPPSLRWVLSPPLPEPGPWPVPGVAPGTPAHQDAAHTHHLPKRMWIGGEGYRCACESVCVRVYVWVYVQHNAQIFWITTFYQPSSSMSLSAQGSILHSQLNLQDKQVQWITSYP